MPAPHSRSDQALVALRSVVALIMISHGIYRALADGFVPGFGEFLGSKGFPFGYALAVAITGWEIVGGALLLAGRWVGVVALLFVAELAFGIVLVHAPDGWFVVGGGRNGMEFSVLLIAVFAAVAWASPPATRTAAECLSPNAAGAALRPPDRSPHSTARQSPA